MSNTVDLFSGKDIKEIEEEDQKIKEEDEERFKLNALSMLESVKTLVENGDLSTLLILATTDGGAVKPEPLYINPSDLHALGFLIEESRQDVHERTATGYGLRQYEYIEE